MRAGQSASSSARSQLQQSPTLSMLILSLRAPNQAGYHPDVTMTRQVKCSILKWAQNSLYRQVTSYISGSLAGCARMRIGSASVVLDIQALRFLTEQSGRFDGWSHAPCRTVRSGLENTAMLGLSRTWSCVCFIADRMGCQWGYPSQPPTVRFLKHM